MTISRYTRRALLGGAAALAATGSLSLPPHRAAAQVRPNGKTGRAPIDAVLQRAIEEKQVPGVVAMAANGRGVFYEGAFGTRDLAQGPAMTTDTIFRIASMTKAITSVAAMQLVEQGKLDLDKPIGNVLPELAAPQVLDGFDEPARRSCGRRSGRSRCDIC